MTETLSATTNRVLILSNARCNPNFIKVETTHTLRQGTRMLIETNYVFLSLLLLIYSVWHYLKRKERGWLYLTSGFTFLTASTTLQLINSLIWLHGIQANRITLRLLELAGLALFACFTICTIMALRKISKTSNN